MVKVDLRNIVQVMLQFGLNDVMGQHRVEERSLQLYAIVREGQLREFQVVSHLHDFL